MSESTNHPRVVLKSEDFGNWDRDVAECAGGELFAVLDDLMHHNYSAGDGYYPFAEDIPGIIAEVRSHIERIETAIKKAKAEIASIERPARLAAYRRVKAEEAQNARMRIADAFGAVTEALAAEQDRS